jgi:hypothetical protein
MQKPKKQEQQQSDAQDKKDDSSAPVTIATANPVQDKKRD